MRKVILFDTTIPMYQKFKKDKNMTNQEFFDLNKKKNGPDLCEPTDLESFQVWSGRNGHFFGRMGN